ncbi:hypothetical protein Tco_1000404 [Tanacetum coccineum]
MGLPSTHPDDGTSKTQPLPEGTNIDPKDSGRNAQLADRGQPKALFSNQSETSLEVESDTDTLILTIVADIQALLGDSVEDIDEEFLQSANEETQHAHSTETPTEEPFSTKHQSPSPNKDQLESFKDKKTDASDSESSSCSETFKPFNNYMPLTERQLEKHEEAAASYADLKWSIDDFLTTTFNQILNNLQEVQNVVKEEPALNKKVLGAVEAYTKNSTNLTELLTMPNRGKGIARDTDEYPRKLVPASKEVHQDPDALVLIQFEINAKLLALSKPELIKVVTEVATEAVVDPKALLELKGLQRHDQKNFEVHKPFRFGDFGITEWDELNEIIPKKKNKVVGELMTSLGKKYERLKMIPEEIRINPSLPAPEQVLSLSSRRKRKAQELELEVRIPGLECNRSLLEGVQFVINQVIEHPKNGIFFIDVFDDEAFQRISNIHKVDVDTLLSYMMMASNINTPENQRFCAVMRSLIDSHPDKEKLKSKRVKLEAVRYLLN